MDRAKAAIISTLAYSDIFNYPLTKAEIWRYLAADKTLLFGTFEKTLSLCDEVKCKDKFFYFSGRSNIVDERLKRKKISDKKLEKAKKIAGLLFHIPTIQLIGISGSLAMYNADQSADIDLFIIVKKNTIWISRFFILLILQLKQIRRKRSGKKTSNTVCVNMFIDTGHLVFPPDRRDFYTAHELLQMKPLFAKGYIYHEFLRKNKWISTMLHNGFPGSVLKEIPREIQKGNSFPKFIEAIFKYSQVWYMRNHITHETIREGFVAFHPNDYKNEILREWERLKNKYGI